MKQNLLQDPDRAAEWDVMMGEPSATWLSQQTPAIKGWKAEDAAFASYCANRDMGIDAEALTRFFAPYWADDFERRYRDERHYGAAL